MPRNNSRRRNSRYNKSHRSIRRALGGMNIPPPPPAPVLMRHNAYNRGMNIPPPPPAPVLMRHNAFNGEINIPPPPLHVPILMRHNAHNWRINVPPPPRKTRRRNTVKNRRPKKN